MHRPCQNTGFSATFSANRKAVSFRAVGIFYNLLNLFNNLARPERFELPTTWFEARYSIQLSYGREPHIIAQVRAKMYLLAINLTI